MKRVEELGISPMPWYKRVRFDVNELVSTDEYGQTQIVLSWTNDVINKKTPNNARLIAASPELYEALRSAVIQMCHYCPLCDYADGEYRCKENADKCFVNKWRNALAKASGEEAK